MATYVDNIRNPPRTLTEAEQRRLLKVSGEHKAGFRDHLLFSLALGTGLREHEIKAELEFLASRGGPPAHTHAEAVERTLRVVQRVLGLEESAEAARRSLAASLSSCAGPAPGGGEYCHSTGV